MTIILAGVMMGSEKYVSNKRSMPSVDKLKSIKADREWRKMLVLNKQDRPLPGWPNVDTAISLCPEWNGVFALDDFSRRAYLVKRPPYDDRTEKFERKLFEGVEEEVSWLSNVAGIVATEAQAKMAIARSAKRNKYNPLWDYFHSINGKWDGKERLDFFLSDYFGVADSEYVRAVSRKFLIGCVARALDPGCQMDNMLIIEGEGGIGKSTGIRALVPDESWYADSLGDINAKDTLINIQGIWILELAELAGHSRRETEAQKAFITRVSDRFRPVFGLAAVNHPRYTVFIGTTNREHYLMDETGNRRYWPVRATSVDVAGIGRDRDQIWAEAVHAWLEGEAWHLVGDEVGLAKDEQRERFDDDPWTSTVMKYIQGRDRVSRDEILGVAIGLVEKDRDRRASMRVGSIMRINGWVEKQSRSGSGRGMRYFVKIEQD